MKEADKQHQKPFTSDGSGIFWKRNKFTCVKSTSMNYYDPVNNDQWGQVGVAVSVGGGGGGSGGGACCGCCCLLKGGRPVVPGIETLTLRLNAFCCCCCFGLFWVVLVFVFGFP